MNIRPGDKLTFEVEEVNEHFNEKSELEIFLRFKNAKGFNNIEINSIHHIEKRNPIVGDYVKWEWDPGNVFQILAIVGERAWIIRRYKTGRYLNNRGEYIAEVKNLTTVDKPSD